MSDETPDARPLAERLLAAGIPVVVVRHGERYPDDWQRLTADQCDLSSYRPGRDALAMVGGHGLDLVDEDTKADGSVENLPPFKHFGVTRTPTGGRHFVVPSNGLGKISPLTTDDGHVGDYVGGRADGTGRLLGFLPGSVRSKPEHGGRPYAEEEAWDVESCLDAKADVDLMLVLTGCGGSRKERERYIDDSPERDPALGVHPYARKAIESELQRLRDLPYPWAKGASYWDETTYEVACNLLEFANSGWSGYTEDDAFRDLLDNAPSDEAWGEREHRAKWASALNTVDGGGRREPPERERSTAADDFEPVDGGEQAKDQQFPTLDLVALLDPDRPPRRWLWDGLIPAGDSASVVAPGGTGKSLLVLSLCLAAVSGRREFIGRTLDFDGRVLYVDMENSEDDWAERLRDLGWTQESVRTIAGRFLPLSLPPLRGLDTEEGARQLRGILTARGIGEGDLLVLDSMQRVTEGEENSNDTLRNLYNLTSAWLKARKVTVVRTDNTGWDEGRERGASSKRDDVGYSLLLKPVDRRTGRFSLVNTKHRSKGRSDALDFTRTTDLNGRLHWQAVSPVDTSADLDFEMPRHMADTLGVLAMLTDAKGANYEGDLIASQTALQLVPGKNDTKRNGIELLVTQGYLHKDAIPLANGEPSKRQGYRLTDLGRAWVAEQGDALAARQAELATRGQR